MDRGKKKTQPKLKLLIYIFFQWTSCTFTENLGGNRVPSGQPDSLAGFVHDTWMCSYITRIATGILNWICIHISIKVYYLYVHYFIKKTKTRTCCKIRPISAAFYIFWEKNNYYSAGFFWNKLAIIFSLFKPHILIFQFKEGSVFLWVLLYCIW